MNKKNNYNLYSRMVTTLELPLYFFLDSDWVQTMQSVLQMPPSHNLSK